VGKTLKEGRIGKKREGGDFQRAERSLQASIRGKNIKEKRKGCAKKGKGYSKTDARKMKNYLYA